MTGSRDQVVQFSFVQTRTFVVSRCKTADVHMSLRWLAALVGLRRDETKKGP